MPSGPLFGVKERRILLDITQAQIAKAVGMDPNSYARMERGERRCYLDRALIIGRMLHTPLEDLGRDPTTEERIRLVDIAAKRRAEEQLTPEQRVLNEAGWTADAQPAAPVAQLAPTIHAPIEMGMAATQGPDGEGQGKSLEELLVGWADTEEE